MGVPNSLKARGMAIVVWSAIAATVSFSALAQQAATSDVASATSATDDPQVEARENFALGQEAYEAKDFEAADKYFSRAYELKPHPSALKMIAECKLQLGQLPEAVTIMEQLLEDDAYKKKKKLKRRYNKAKKQLGKLTVESTPAGAVVSVNGVLQEEKTPTTLYVNPGNQDVVLLMEGYPEQSRDLFVAAKAVKTVSVDYSEIAPVAENKRELIDPFDGEPEEEVATAEVEVPEEEPTVVAEPDLEDDVAVVEVESDGPPKAFWVAAAIAGVGVVSGTVFGTMALRDEKDFKDSGDSATRDSGKRAAVIADVSFGVAICAAVTGAIILISNKNKKEKASLGAQNARFYVSPGAGKDAIGLASGFSF